MPRPTRATAVLAAALTIAALAAAALAAPLRAQPPAQPPGHQHDTTRIDTNRIAVMSPEVARQRLRLLGYTDVAVMEHGRAAVRASARKAGRAYAVRLDPYTGKVAEAPGRLERARDGLRLVRPDGAAATPP